MDDLLRALTDFAQPHVIGVVILAATYGLFVGAIPGLTATMAVALIVPVTFFLDDISALAAIVTLEACAIFAGDIPTALLRIPGTPSSAAYADDAFALTCRGRQELALGVSLTFSVTGGLLGVLVLVLLAPELAEVAAGEFSSLEYFWLTVLGLGCAVAVSRDSAARGAIGLLTGLLISTIGLSAVHGSARFTFGRDELAGGIDFIPAMIGLFGVSEILRNVSRLPGGGSSLPRRQRGADDAPAAAEARPEAPSSEEPSGGSFFGRPLRLLWRRKLPVLRSAGLGSFVGMLPGAGADIGAWIAYAVSKRFSRRPREYGRGSIEGVADATSANNAALASAWIPTLVFGIPGDSVTAIVIGVLLMKNVQPGPDIFVKQASLVYGIWITFFFANLVLLPLGWLAVRAGSLLLRVPRRVLLPVILLFCIVGSYAIGGSYFDIWVMLVMGLLGFGLERARVPLGPVVLGIILGGRLEETFIQSLTKASSWLDFFARPWAAGIAVAALSVWGLPVLLSRRRRVASSLARGGRDRR